MGNAWLMMVEKVCCSLSTEPTWFAWPWILMAVLLSGGSFKQAALLCVSYGVLWLSVSSKQAGWSCGDISIGMDEVSGITTVGVIYLRWILTSLNQMEASHSSNEHHNFQKFLYNGFVFLSWETPACSSFCNDLVEKNYSFMIQRKWFSFIDMDYGIQHDSFMVPESLLQHSKWLVKFLHIFSYYLSCCFGLCFTFGYSNLVLLILDALV